MENRAFFVRAEQNWRGKITGYVISDGLNEIHLAPYDYFLLDTTEPLTKPLIYKDRL
jgi:hypothetical protein